MLIKSQAGEFSIGISRFENEAGDLVMVGAMGVWEARTYISPREAVGLLGTVLSSGAIWLFVLKLPFAIFRRV